MRLTIIPADGAVYKDNYAYNGLNLSFAPPDVHALQWYDTYGEVEFKRQIINGQIFHPSNQFITELPEWVSQAIVKWDEAKVAEEAAIAAAIEAARIAAEEVTNNLIEEVNNG